MKNQFQHYVSSTKVFMRKHALLFVTLKVLKVVLVFCLFSCGSKPENSGSMDTILVDSIQGNSPTDSTNFRNTDEEEEEEENEDEEGGENPLVPQES